MVVSRHSCEDISDSEDQEMLPPYYEKHNNSDNNITIKPQNHEDSSENSLDSNSQLLQDDKDLDCDRSSKGDEEAEKEVKSFWP